jgi:hypothetical protein
MKKQRYSPLTPLRETCDKLDDDMKRTKRYQTALEQIAALANATEVRGPLEDIGVPDHKVKDGGWVPIHPRLKDGLCYAAKIAKAALEPERTHDE